MLVFLGTCLWVKVGLKLFDQEIKTVREILIAFLFCHSRGGDHRPA